MMNRKEEISFSKRTKALLMRCNDTQAKMLDLLVFDFLRLDSRKQKTALTLLDDFSNIDDEKPSTTATLYESDPVES